MRVIIDFDGTLTAEEEQQQQLAHMSLTTLASEIIGVARQRLERDYSDTRKRLLAAPDQYWWEVNGLIASYCDEGAFILNTTTLQVMLREDQSYRRAVAAFFPRPEYDAVVDCTNYLFHRHTAELPVAFRPHAPDILTCLLRDPRYAPMILTNSLGDKVRRHLAAIGLEEWVDVLGDTRQYEMNPDWRHLFSHPQLGPIHVWPVSASRRIDLRRPAYYSALCRAAIADPQLAVVADTLSLPGAVPLMMGIPFFLLRTSYTPDWCAQVVETHPGGRVLSSLDELPDALETLLPAAPREEL